MITRKLLAALVGVSLAAGTLGIAVAQTAAPMATQSASPSDTMSPATAAKSDTTTRKTPVRKHHARMTKTTGRKHLSLRGTKHVAAKHTARKHLAGKPVAGKRLVSKHTGVKVAQHANKRIRLSHFAKRGTKHV